MRISDWSSDVCSSDLQATCDAAGSACGCATNVKEALSPPPINLPGGVVYRIHGMDCADEIAALKREVGPPAGEDKQIGRAPARERVWQDVWISGVGV